MTIRKHLSQYLLVGPRAYYILRPENLEAILSTDFRGYGFGARASVFAPLLGHGIFTQEGAAWRHPQELLRKQFVNARLRRFDHFIEHVDNLIANIPSHGVVDLQPLFFKFTLDTTIRRQLFSSEHRSTVCEQMRIKTHETDDSQRASTLRRKD
ncbi:hypothetical protein BU23DRAFT_481462 [Bimuria novae-zelandiae CBS 107.79]|uniref:Cytochrome P450 n=1 Tax=Bimuria novae-zelandiae CBS 107.79 TaxID=1447943 RepID=A0A6A5UZ23_9PLEO|nr:hypothetical protein BU23DRAFT_481462 [Bimuria novae-zelandiae CBS 107.79]